MPANFSSISFPSFGIEVNPSRIISLGPLTIHYYGLIIATGLMLAVLYCCKRSDQFGLKEDDVLDGVLWITPFAIICARIYYCVFSWQEFAADPISVLYIWNGGIAIYGGVLGAILGMAVFCRIKKIKLTTVLDLVLLGFLIGQSIGRWGNFFNQEAFGGNTDLPWAMTGDIIQAGYNGSGYDPTQPVHPTFLYESLWCILGFVLLHILSKRIVRRFDGMIFCGYMVWYGAGRFAIESLRTDSLMAGTMRTSQLVAILAILLGVVLFFVLRRYSLSLPKALVIAVKDEGDTQEEATEEVEIQAETTPDTTEEDTDGTAN